MGYLLHPTILEALPDDTHIVDIGCGTGIWLSELSASLPRTACLTGFDIASDQFRSPTALPSNVNLQIADCKEPFPVEHHGKYDAVHLRLLVTALDPQDWEKVSRHCMQLLKPSGWIQWDEANLPQSRRALRGEVDSTVSHINSLTALPPVSMVEHCEQGWSTLPKIFSSIGLQVADTDLVSSDRVLENRKAATMVSIDGLWSMLKNLQAKTGRDLVSEEEMRRGVDKDVESGAYLRFDIHVAVSFLFSKAIYNLYFHPLKSYPGPWFARTSRLWYVFTALGGYQKYAIKDLHEKYGQVVRIAPNEISYIRIDAWNDIYGTLAHEGVSRLEKDDDLFGVAFGGSDSIVGANSENFKDQKTNAMRGFSHGAVASKSEVMSTYMETSIQNLKSWAEKHNEPVDIEAFVGNTFLDVHARLTIGSDFGAVEDEDPRLHFLVRQMHNATAVLQYCVHITYLPSAVKSIPSMFGGIDVFSIFDGLYPIGPAITKRVEGGVGAQKNDFVSYMENVQGPDDNNRDRVKKNAYNFILSGMEGMPGFVCSSLYYLLKDPKYYRDASSRIRSRFHHASMINADSAQNIPLLRAIIQETLRISPPFVGISTRRVPCGGSTICGKYVAEGMTVGIHHYSVTHHSLFWKDPDCFRPERWLGDDEFADDHREVFHPFGYGPRVCIARQ
ncbi:MAG: hypothetical protein M1828_006867 [Chrysothrix sp. TS-e1954]|nr:MAG: hypothetical protein M1828_006867 [Chrysothrix sp. TS-e1954]